jgi:beta-glucanase (GH16 family)
MPLYQRNAENHRTKESYNGSAYTSARMLSYNLYSFQYGKIDVRAKLPASTGTW